MLCARFLQKRFLFTSVSTLQSLDLRQKEVREPFSLPEPIAPGLGVQLVAVLSQHLLIRRT